MSILGGLMREVLVDIDVLSTLSSTDDFVSHSVHAVLSSKTGVGTVAPNWRFLRRFRR